MKNRFLADYKKLGVINMTPNSFSDGGFHLNHPELKKSLILFSQIKNLIIDIGAESTAPMNQAISFEEEKIRLDEFLSIADEINLFSKIKIISLDTYKLEIFDYFYNEIRKRKRTLKIIFNDVSGVINNELISFLKTKKNIYYIYSASRINDRNSVLQHMLDFKSSGNICNEVNVQFLKTIDKFEKHKLENILILDPAFGFSKTHDENLELLENFSAWSKEIHYPILIGISKKSFLRKKIESDDPKNDSEFIHYYFLKNLNSEAKSLKKQLLFRVHNPYIL